MEKSLELAICIWDWKSYNDGVQNFMWFYMEDFSEIPEHLEYLKEQGLEEPFICDTDCNINISISEYTNINSVIELSEHIQDIEDEVFERMEAFSMDEFNDIFYNTKPEDIARMVYNGDYNPFHEYFRFNGYGNIVTLNEFEYKKLKEETLEEVINDYL